VKTTNTHKIGVMQGRLVPKFNNQYQAHPIGYWDSEFDLGARVGLDLIEFIVDLAHIESNPLMNAEGLANLATVISRSGVNVSSVCADCFMSAPLHSSSAEIAASSQTYLRRLIDHAPVIGISDIVIPCVDQASLRTKEDEVRFIAALEPLLPAAEKNNVNLALETDLNPQKFGWLLEQLKCSRVSVNYDTGNSAALGYDPREELAIYGSRITDIHIKDRVRGGGSVVLGTGDTDFDAVFESLVPFNYTGFFILQAYRDEEGLAIFKKQLSWIKPYIKQLASGSK